jgi:arsenate reductase
MIKKEKIIFICTENACRSQIAEGLMRHLAHDKYEVYSAGSHPARVHPAAITVMNEVGIDISFHSSDPISLFKNKSMDIVITVCGNANKTCPVFPGKVERIHWTIKDPSKNWNASSKDLVNFRKTRDDLTKRIKNLLKSQRTSYFQQ